MRHVEPNGESPRAFLESLIDRGDARFEDMFLEDAGLNAFANNAAEQVSGARHAILQQTFQDVDPNGLSRYHFAVKKLVFLFTNPEDYLDSVTGAELDSFLEDMEERGMLGAGDDFASYTRRLNFVTNCLMSLYKPQTEATYGEDWNAMAQSEKFNASFNLFTERLGGDWGGSLDLL